MIGSALERLGRWVVGSPRGVLLFLSLMTLGALLFLPRFRIESDIATVLPGDFEAVELRRIAATELTSDRNLLMILRGESVAASIPEVVDTLLASPLVESVAATTEDFLGDRVSRFRENPLIHLSEEGLSRLSSRMFGEGRKRVLSGIPRRIAEDPFLSLQMVRRDPLDLAPIFEDTAREKAPATLDSSSRFVVLADGSAAFLRIRGKKKPFDIEYSKALLGDLNDRLSNYSHTFIGGYAIACQDEQRIRLDLYRSSFLSAFLVSIFLLVSGRSFWDPLLLVGPIGIVIVWTLGYGGVMLGPLTPLATGAAAVLVGLGVDFGIHYLQRYREERLRGSYDEAVVSTHVGAGRPLLLSMMTTVLAFLSLALSRFHGLFGFGILLGIGLVFALLSALVVLPWMLRVLTRSTPKEATSRVIECILALVKTRIGKGVTAGIIGFALLGWGWVGFRGVSFDADPSRLRPSDDPMLASAAWLEESLGFSPIPVTVLVNGKKPLLECKPAVEELEAKGLVRLSLGPHQEVASAGIDKRVADFRGRLPGWVDATCKEMEEVGLEPDGFRDELVKLSRSLEQSPDPPTPQIRYRGEVYWMIQLFPPHLLRDRESRVAMEEAIVQSFEEDVHIVAAMGLSDDLSDLLSEDLVRCTALSGLAVLVVVFLFSGGILAAVLSLVPTLAGIGITLGWMAFFEAPLHLGNFVAVPFLLGIGLDDGIHMVGRYREAQRLGSEQPTDEVLRTTGYSVWRTSVTTFLGFGSLAFSATPGLSSLGLLLAVGIGVCFLTSVFALPVLCRCFLPVRGPE